MKQVLIYPTRTDQANLLSCVFCFSRCVLGFVAFLFPCSWLLHLKSKPVLRRGPAGEDANSRKSLFEVPIIDLNKICFTRLCQLEWCERCKEPRKATGPAEMTNKWRVLVDPVIKANPVIWTILCSSHQFSHLRKASKENEEKNSVWWTRFLLVLSRFPNDLKICVIGWYCWQLRIKGAVYTSQEAKASHLRPSTLKASQ